MHSIEGGRRMWPEGGMNVRRDFLLLVTLSVTAAAPAVAQTSASIPDLSGACSQRAERPGTAAVRARSGKEQAPRAHRTAGGRRQPPPAGRRLHQPDPAALGGESGEEVWRDVAGGARAIQGLSDAAQPVLARAGAVRICKLWNADPAAAGQDHDPLPLRPPIPPNPTEQFAAERAASVSRDAKLVWRFRRPL
jgi:hypothetical protein